MLLRPKLGEPLLAGWPADPAAECMGQSREDHAAVTDQTQVHVAVLSNRSVVEVNLDHSRIRSQTPAVAHPEVERRPHDDDQVGVLEGVAPALVKVVGRAGGQGAAAGAVHEGRKLAALPELTRLLGGP